ncbi:BZ3500_MvSof-1268-A1-R1_Chr2-1g04354 [Microbotryum saponariae]|uniref:BZ3500_MvSof-1268-A1-R1_Chr2-1g04354 protein n=1 Tax=Microbotryum saponariae TaxID=289078 RepID=A0A2X0K662_9BASI|nr:BZ3500_MvSof-1268-A1-R1_Chr2-1g04354 [Microbotryum saponariae]SCZ91523.1 BZ3501_MvSof-1269-A2-R1_Chr2-1g04010 [Microbotryum saponariae]
MADDDSAPAPAPAPATTRVSVSVSGSVMASSTSEPAQSTSAQDTTAAPIASAAAPETEPVQEPVDEPKLEPVLAPELETTAQLVEAPVSVSSRPKIDISSLERPIVDEERLVTPEGPPEDEVQALDRFASDATTTRLGAATGTSTTTATAEHVQPRSEIDRADATPSPPSRGEIGQLDAANGIVETPDGPPIEHASEQSPSTRASATSTNDDPLAPERSLSEPPITPSEFEDVQLSTSTPVALPASVLADAAAAVAEGDPQPARSQTPPPALPTKPNPTPERVASPSVPVHGSPSSRVVSSTSSPRIDSAESQPHRSSIASTTTISAPGSQSLVSGILVISALETIGASKEAKKSKPLKDAVDVALEALKHPQGSTSAGSGAGSDGTVDPHLVFEPLRLACESKSLPLMITALDCIGKLVSYDFFVDQRPPSHYAVNDAASATNDEGESVGSANVPIDQIPLADLVTSTVCDCFSPSPAGAASNSTSAGGAGATTPHDTLLLRLLSSLLSLILSTSLEVHQSSLLKAVRTVYNVFLLGRPGTVQTVAQATLGQIVGGVFGRIKLGPQSLIPGDVTPATAAGSVNGKSGYSSRNGSLAGSKADLASVEEEGEATKEKADVAEENQTEKESESLEAPQLVVKEAVVEGETSEVKKEEAGTEASTSAPALENVNTATTDSQRSFEGTPITAGGDVTVNRNDLYIKDAFLVFRALCKLSMKPLGSDSERDLKSHAMRSKLLSLHLVLNIVNNYLPAFVDPHVSIISSTSRDRTPFIQAIKQYLCLALSRNAVSPVIQVFELSCEIFWRVLQGLRTKLKKEIEVLLNEIFLPILEMRNSTIKQKSILLAVFGRVSQDPQALVDIYLNYDCDRSSLENIYERLINIVSKLGTTQFPASTDGKAAAQPSAASTSPFPTPGPTLSDDSRMTDPALSHLTPEMHLKRQALEALVTVLRSLVSWAARGGATTTTMTGSELNGSMNANLPPTPRSEEADTDYSDTPRRSLGAAPASVDLSRSRAQTPDVVPADDPSRFENAKQRKTTLLEGIKKFNFKPKRGVSFLIETGFIRSSEPKDVARFLLHADGLDKAQIGEYLGEGDAENIATMHAFVDLMDFTNTAFVDALRAFLQSFRLPGEAQKIDRYMLKFAERYTAGNPGVFANADTAYILAFSVILLNTDAHNPQVKKPMSKVEFIRNNRGIDDGNDLDEALLVDIYDEINRNEIRMKDEVEAAGPQGGAGGIANALATVGRDLQREQYVWQSEGMVNKTEALFRTLVRGQRRGASAASAQFYSASHFEHVKPMFEVVWMPFLAGISAPLQTTDDMDLITLSLQGFKQAIKIVCLFDLELERNAFVTTLAKFTFLNDLGEMKAKNVEAIKTLLDVAMVDGNYLKGSWREVVTCVSQLERFQLIAQGVDSQAVPELGRKPSTTSRRSTLTSRARNSRPTEQVALETRSQHITITADMIFSSTPNLSGTAIVDFVRALSEVSWEEIQASGLAEQPRVFCLQKLVEISYYNMNRIRLEWSQIWLILGEHFNQVTCHTNAKVSFLALDSLRQLAMRFLEKEELANFRFQKDFLKPFEYAMVHNNNPDARDMVLQCLHQMIQARVQNLRSGWRTMFGVFAAAAKVLNERIAVQAFDIVQRVNREHFARIVEYGSFADLTVCVTDFCKISKYQRVSLQAIELVKALIPMMLECPQCPLSENAIVKSEASPNDDPMLKFWFPILFGFYDVIMNAEDLEVRKRALDYLFETLKTHGSKFPPEFWDTICKEVLFPIFAVLRSRSDVSRFSTHEDMSVWLSTTMIQALRNLVDLFSFYFDALARMLDRLLDLLCECICQENDTLARIGTSCLQQLLENNVEKLSPARWERIVSTFVQLFKTTTAFQLFDENLLLPESTDTPAESTDSAAAAANGFVAPTPLSPPTEDVPHVRAPVTDRRRIFRQIIVKCVLQLLLIETTHELLQHERVYTTIPPAELLKLMSALDDSYRFARKFNADKPLRMALWKVGFMRDLPNLLRQESTSAATLVNVLLRMYNDSSTAEHVGKRAEVVEVFAPLGLDVLANYVSLNPDSQARNIAAWTPVCAEILQGFCSLEDEAFKAQLARLYPLVTNTLVRDMDPTVRECVRAVYVRIGRSVLGIGGADSAGTSTTGPAAVVEEAVTSS